MEAYGSPIYFTSRGIIRRNYLKWGFDVITIFSVFSPQFNFIKFSLANRASGEDKTTGIAFNVLTSGIGPVVNFADCIIKSRNSNVCDMLHIFYKSFCGLLDFFDMF